MTNGYLLKQIRQYLRRTGSTQVDLAKVLGTSPMTVNRWLRKKSGISPAYGRLLREKGIVGT